jgi:hypothetical protein
LKEHPEASSDRSEAFFSKGVYPLVSKPDFSGIRPQEADDVLEHDGLSASAGSHDHGGLALGDLKREATEDLSSIEGSMDVLQSHHRRWFLKF